MPLGRVAAILLLLASVGGSQDVGTKPMVRLYPTDGTTVEFLVTASNSTGANLHVISYIAHCRPRIDGSIVEKHFMGGSGGGRQIPPGDTWQELHRIFLGPPKGMRMTNPDPTHIAASVPLWLTALSPGRHVIAFTCGGAWSDDLSFDWPPHAARSSQ